MGPRGAARLAPATVGRQRLRIRGHATERCFEQGQPVRIEVHANGSKVGRWTLERNGLFILEADLSDATEYRIDLEASPVWQHPPDDRLLTVNISLIRLVGE
jgi:hypothetical protein